MAFCLTGFVIVEDLWMIKKCEGEEAKTKQISDVDFHLRCYFEENLIVCGCVVHSRCTLNYPTNDSDDEKVGIRNVTVSMKESKLNKHTPTKYTFDLSSLRLSIHCKCS